MKEKSPSNRILFQPTLPCHYTVGRFLGDRIVATVVLVFNCNYERYMQTKLSELEGCEDVRLENARYRVEETVINLTPARDMSRL